MIPRSDIVDRRDCSVVDFGTKPAVTAAWVHTLLLDTKKRITTGMINGTKAAKETVGMNR